MGATGTTTIDFGAFPGKTDTTATVTGQASILAGSLVGAWIRPVATADHSIDEHRVESLEVIADTIVAGTGFTIFGCIRNDFGQSTRLYGSWTVAWAWT